MCIVNVCVLVGMRVAITTALCVLCLFVCKIDFAVLWLPGIISSSHREILDKARANISINGRMVKRHGERKATLSSCGASPGFQ